MEIKLTKSATEKIPFSTGKPIIYRDTDTNGLGLLVGKQSKSFFVERKINGKTVRISLGRVEDISCENARQKADEMRGRMAGGVNPIDEKRAKEAVAVTLGEAFLQFMETRNLKARTIYDYRKIMNGYFLAWKDRKIVDITKDQIDKAHKELGANHGEAQANQAMRVLRSIINFAIGKYEDAKGNPLITVNPVSRLSATRAWFPNKVRQGYIKEHQLAAFFNGVNALKGGHPQSKADVVKDYVIFLLLTGLRRTEAATLKWSDVDFQGKTFTIGETKNGQPHTLPLSDYLVTLLKNRYEHRKNDYVFPGKKKDAFLVTPKRHLVFISKKSGLTFTLHDLRRTFITVAESLDISSYAVKMLVNHKQKGDVTAGYIIRSHKRLSEPMQKITDYILRNAGLNQQGVVIQLPKKTG